MANRQITVLNPDGYQEVLQSADTLVVGSPISFAGGTYSSNVSFTTADFSGNVTINGTPTAGTDAATKAYVDASSASVALTSNLPITINSQVIDINYATDSTDGSIRLATNAEVAARTAVDAAVTPGQLVSILDDIVITGVSPVVVTETSSNNWSVDVNYATNAADGTIRIATDVESSARTLETVAVNCKQVADRIADIPNASEGTHGLIRLARGSDITARINTNRAVTPAQLAQEVDTVGVTVHTPLTVVETDRVFDLDITYATDTAEGTMRFATGAELTAGTATNVAITPALLETRLGGLEIQDGTTTDKGFVRFATGSETATGTESDAAVTPESMRFALDQATYVLDGGTY